MLALHSLIIMLACIFIMHNSTKRPTYCTKTNSLAHLERFAKLNHVIHHILIVGNDPGLKSLNGQRKDVGHHQGLGRVGIGTAEHQPHNLDGVAPLLQSLLHAGMAVHQHLHDGRGAEGGRLEVLGVVLPRRRRAEGGEAGFVEGVARVGLVEGSGCRGGGVGRGGYRFDLHV